ncbi:OLC1v1038435C1 [Oldenlandia corymbosa var. corymbosa]|uniref:OLC1v1038435C1 n=1 Tax=Oldenlandia corymbosa var. corymbosa TaxID=529605 RepID=A0AAV1CZZ9_OLDCO|nr:OLC1v1038435C1 [Oldenlandia corymbosa var. corymbosa]
MTDQLKNAEPRLVGETLERFCKYISAPICTTLACLRNYNQREREIRSMGDSIRLEADAIGVIVLRCVIAVSVVVYAFRQWPLHRRQEKQEGEAPDAPPVNLLGG